MVEQAEFEVMLEETVLKVSEHYVNERRIFHIRFPDKTKPLDLTVIQSQGKKAWTSIPQGRQAEAERIGPLIAWYFKNKKKE